MRKNLNSYAAVYKTYVNELYSYGIGLGFTEDICMDAIHDVFCKLFVDRRNLDEIDNLKFYLFRSIKNRLLDTKKRSYRISYDNYGEHSFVADVTLVDDDLIKSEEHQKLVDRVQSLMDELTSTQREAIYLRYMQELDYDQIGRILNITPESARKLVYRGLEKLRRHEPSIVGLFLLLSFFRHHPGI